MKFTVCYGRPECVNRPFGRIHRLYPRAIWIRSALRKRVSSDEFLRREQVGYLQYALPKSEKNICWRGIRIDHIFVPSCCASLVEDCGAFWGAVSGNMNGTDHAPVRARFMLRLSARPRKSAKHRCYGNVRKTRGAVNCNRKAVEHYHQNTNERSLDGKPMKVTQNEDQRSRVEPRRISKQPKDWISATNVQLSAKAKAARSSVSSEHCGLKFAATRLARVCREVPHRNGWENGAHIRNRWLRQALST